MWFAPFYQEDIEKELNRSTTVATVNGEDFIVASSFIARGTFAKRVSNGYVRQICGRGYISNDLTIRKEIALRYGLPTFRRNAKKA